MEADREHVGAVVNGQPNDSLRFDGGLWERYSSQRHAAIATVHTLWS